MCKKNEVLSQHLNLRNYELVISVILMYLPISFLREECYIYPYKNIFLGYK